MSEFNVRDVFGEFGKKLVEVFKTVSEDLGTLTVVTTTGSVTTIEKKSTGAEVYDIKEEGIVAKTIIEIDGDIIVKLPVVDQDGNAVELNERILEIHEENVAMAMENWRTFITTLVEIAGDLKDLLSTV
ncbi:hypothetical protein E2P65_01000 [Candidatus Bathyarchaeota archaeon]|nr:hypothetical protein E2P65_01000 [Candidatus Bathyarchaeota archaeon]